MASSHWDPTCHVGCEGATRKQQEETSPALTPGLQGAAEPRTLPAGPSPPRPEGQGHSLVLLSQGLCSPGAPGPGNAGRALGGTQVGWPCTPAARWLPLEGPAFLPGWSGNTRAFGGLAPPNLQWDGEATKAASVAGPFTGQGTSQPWGALTFICSRNGSPLWTPGLPLGEAWVWRGLTPDSEGAGGIVRLVEAPLADHPAGPSH